jgi:hypothetical protein
MSAETGPVAGIKLTDFFDRIMDDRIMLPGSGEWIFDKIMDGKIILAGAEGQGVARFFGVRFGGLEGGPPGPPGGREENDLSAAQS